MGDDRETIAGVLGGCMETHNLETQCHLCGGPLIDGRCEAYNWNDSVHLRNRRELLARNTVRVHHIETVSELEDFLKS
jgi:hypothetical protein